MRRGFNIFIANQNISLQCNQLKYLEKYKLTIVSKLRFLTWILIDVSEDGIKLNVREKKTAKYWKLFLYN